MGTAGRERRREKGGPSLASAIERPEVDRTLDVETGVSRKFPQKFVHGMGKLFPLAQ
jgi:hypothetical protein